MEAADIIEEDSGSAYEISSDGEQSSSHEEIDSRAVSRHSRGRSASAAVTRSHHASSKGSKSSDSVTSSSDTRKIRRDAVQWASGFQHTQTPEDIESPSRQAFGTRGKRKSDISATELRAKRLKLFHSSEYRELLNTEIHHASLRVIPHDHVALDSSQIGSSIWTSSEKELFFSALSRLGRDYVQGIAVHVRSKSELQVQEYIHVLHETTKERSAEDRRTQRLISFTDYPAALEISDECCSVLERAADALASRQESFEEQKEEKKWGGVWLLNSDISRYIEKKGRKKEGEEEIEETLPAANFFNLKNWLTLSLQVFMNPAAPREEENWQAFAEPGETPAIRATALEDFHSLAVSITKRLISATLFCTQSRLRSTKAKKIKHAEINQDDVEAAVKMLGLKLNSGQFWRGCPRRCNLDVFDDEQDGKSSGEVNVMTYDEVELAMGTEREPQSRRRSESISLYGNSERAGSGRDIVDSEAEDLTNSQSEFDASLSNDDSLHTGGSELEHDEPLDIINGGPVGLSKRRQKSKQKRIEEEKANKRAQEEYTQAYDQEANIMEEQRLWALLKQSPPSEIKLEPIEMPDRPKNPGNEVAEPDWRDNLEYWSQWETLPTPITAEDFTRNRERQPERAAIVARRADPASRISRSVSLRDEEVSQEESDEKEDGLQLDLEDSEVSQSSDGDDDNEFEDGAEDLVDPDLHAREDGSPRSPPSRGRSFTGSEEEVAVESEDDDL